jgi:hypothetical protein
MYATDALFISFALIVLIVFGGGLPTSFLTKFPPQPIENVRIYECEVILACFLTVLYVTSYCGKFFRLISIWAHRCLVGCGREKGANTYIDV